MLDETARHGLFERVLSRKFQAFYDLVGDAEEGVEAATNEDNLRKDALEVINFFNNPFLREMCRSKVLASAREQKMPRKGSLS